jgi:hypothetical protein
LPYADCAALLQKRIQTFLASRGFITGGWEEAAHRIGADDSR